MHRNVVTEMSPHRNSPDQNGSGRNGSYRNGQTEKSCSVSKGGPIVDFSRGTRKYSSRGGAKSGEISFYLLESKKNLSC